MTDHSFENIDGAACKRAELRRHGYFAAEGQEADQHKDQDPEKNVLRARYRLLVLHTRSERQNMAEEENARRIFREWRH